MPSASLDVSRSITSKNSPQCHGFVTLTNPKADKIEGISQQCDLNPPVNGRTATILEPAWRARIPGLEGHGDDDRPALRCLFNRKESEIRSVNLKRKIVALADLKSDKNRRWRIIDIEVIPGHTITQFDFRYVHFARTDTYFKPPNFFNHES
jgi:hypothetical protein